jgi:hypothetical protein
MGLLERFQDKLIALRSEARLRIKHRTEGKPAPELTEAQVAAGHPGVSVESDFRGLVYGTRVSNTFGWVWLIVTLAMFGLFMYASVQGVVRVGGRLVTSPEWWHFLGVVAFFLPFLLIGLAFTVSRYRITLTDERISVRWRILPFIGWTWGLAVAEEVAVRLAYDGTEINGQPVPAVVMVSGGEESSFGSMLTDDVKEYLAGAIQHFYGMPAQARPVAPPDLPR